MTDRNLFDKSSAWIRLAEESIINLASAVAPWLVPIIPAYLSYWHTLEILGFPRPVAWTAASVVELLGLSSMRTAVSFMEHNKRYSSNPNRAPAALAIAAYFFYILVVLSVNVLFEWTRGARWDVVLAIFLLTTLSIPAGVLIAIRTQHSELLRELVERKETRKLHAKFSSGGENFSQKTSASLPRDWRRLRPMLSDGEVSNMAILTPAQVKELAGRHNVTEQTVRNWRAQARREMEKIGAVDPDKH